MCKKLEELIGQEVLFSDNKETWYRGVLVEIYQIENEVHYRCKEGTWCYAKPIADTLEELLTPELLSEVIGEEVDSFTLVVNKLGIAPEIYEGMGDVFISMTLKSGKGKSLNLDTLTRKMKEYIVKQGYWVTIGVSEIHQVIITNKGDSILDNQLYRTDSKDTELLSVTKATQWIIDQTKGK